MNGASAVLSGVFAARYAIERELGRGGTAIVYLARDQLRNHTVAIKVLRPEFAESIGADRFLKEIRLSQQLHHPHILPVLDSGKHDGRLYFVLAHMEGGTLRMRLEREKQLPVEDVVAITRSIAMALSHAHEKGLVHRDVKPENILFTSGQACLGDFGIARALENAMDTSTTSTSVIRGTPLYMSPEQAAGQRSYDGRTDIYSLGTVVYEMLAGIQPYVGPTPESVLAQKLTQAPRPLRVYRPGISSAVDGVVARALQLTPADRYQSASQFADALEEASRQPTGQSPVLSTHVRGWLRYAVGIGAIGALATIVSMKMITPRGETGIPLGDPRRIAVLYFDDLSPASVPTHVVDGISEDLIDQLSAVRGLHVISPNGARPFRGSTLGLDSIGRSLKVGTIVSGSVARSGNTVRLSVRLIDAATGQQLFSRPLEQKWTELFALQDTLSEQVAVFLRQRLGEEINVREHRAATKSFAAWEMVRLGSEATRAASDASRRGEPDSWRLLLGADSLFARAEQLDRQWPHPLIARSRIALGLAYRATSAVQVAPDPDDSVAYKRMSVTERVRVWVRRANELADEAVRRAPGSPSSLAVRGEMRYALITFGVASGDTLARRIELDLRAALEQRPDLAAAWSTLAELASYEGRFAEAAVAAQRAYDADPFFRVTEVMSTAFVSSLRAERFDDAHRWCRLGLQLYAGDPRFSECELTMLGWTGKSPRDVAAAWRLLTSIESADSVGMLAPTWGYRRLMIAAVLARAGARDSARNLLKTVMAYDYDKRGTTGLFEANVLLLLGDRTAAMTRLEEFLRTTPQHRTLVANFPWFRALHGDSRFEAAVRSVQ